MAAEPIGFRKWFCPSKVKLKSSPLPLFTWFVSSFFDRLHDHLNWFFIGLKVRCESTFVTYRSVQAAIVQQFLEVVKYLRTHLDRLADAFRRVDPREERYTWWSNRGLAWDNNTGWRIDYQVATPGLADKAVASDIYRDERFSDHAPLTLDYDYDLPGRT